MFKKIYVDKNIAELYTTKEILSKFPKKDIIYLNDINQIKKNYNEISLTEGKKNIILSQYKGFIVKPCPATDESYLCCKYIVINQIVNCPMECTYCILQIYTNTPYITIYTDINKIFNEIDIISRENKNNIKRMGTGELSDSFAFDHITNFSTKLINYISNHRNLILELKTKTINMNNLNSIEKVPPNIVLSWSLNPQKIIDNEEYKTAPLIKRLETAQYYAQKGYKIGFHFDPIIFYKNWENLYDELIENLFKYIDPQKIIWISFGAFRYIPELKEVIQERFPKTNIIYQEYIKGNDGKIRYPKPIRKKMFKYIINKIKKYNNEIFLYFCMESKDIWEEVMGYYPKNNEELDKMFEYSIKKRFKEFNC